jgi:hypothetical protein
MTQCTKNLRFGAIGKRDIRAAFDGGKITSDAGVLLLQEADRRLNLTARLAACIPDWREPDGIRHSLADLLRQRVFQIALGYEDANDADTLRHDPAFKVALGRAPESGAALASQPTLSRLENRIDPTAIQRLLQALVDHWLARRQRPSSGWIILDVDATDVETHGQQEFAAFHAYYDEYCYLPLLIHDGETGDLIVPFLRPGRAAAQTGADGLLRYLVQRVRERWPGVRVLVRGDAGFCGERFYAQLEGDDIFYLLGLARNPVLQRLAEPLQQPLRLLSFLAERKLTAFAEGDYQAESWSRSRRVIVKAERLLDKDNPRFLVTNRDGDEQPETLYRLYCQRGEASENRIKDLLTGCRADRLSCHRFLANFFRLVLHAAAYLLLHHLRQILTEAGSARLEIATLRLHLLKLGARVCETARHIWFHLASGFPFQAAWERLHHDLVLA